jgi:predicted 3-demethylubiquinone-9 3-methyltransferase (glyoxalase superfamily)
VDFGITTEEGETFGLSVFLQDGDSVYRTYFTSDRGVEALGSVWTFLDLTPLGRQEDWEDSPAARPQTVPYTWWRRHDEYDDAEVIHSCVAGLMNCAMQKISPFLWFDGKAEDAARFYTSIFTHSKIESITPMSATFQLDGLEFIALNGGPQFSFTEAISFFVRCETQEEIDYFWEELSAGGEKGRCGWLKDKFGVSWQIVPPVLGEMLNDEDDEKSQRVMQAMLQMGKLDIKALKQAYEQQ